MRFAHVAVLSTTLLATPLQADDLTIVSKQTHGDGASVNTTSYYSSEKMRTTSGEGAEAIFDFASGNITMINHKNKEYSVMTRQEMEALAAHLDAQTKKMEEQMASMPPAVREKMAGMVGGSGANVKVQKGTGGRTIAGYSCQNWIVTMGESMRQEACVTSDLQMPAAAIDGQKKLFGSMGAGPMGKMMTAMLEKFKEMNGFPLSSNVTMKIMGKSMNSTSEVVEVKKGAIPASAFDLPGGYKKVDSPAAKLGGKKK
jgi:hypothetical protein